MEDDSELVMHIPRPYGVFDLSEKLLSVANVTFAWPGQVSCCDVVSLVISTSLLASLILRILLTFSAPHPPSPPPPPLSIILHLHFSRPRYFPTSTSSCPPARASQCWARTAAARHPCSTSSSVRSPRHQAASTNTSDAASRCSSSTTTRESSSIPTCAHSTTSRYFPCHF